MMTPCLSPCKAMKNSQRKDLMLMYKVSGGFFFPKCLESCYLFWCDHLGKGIEKMVSLDKTVIFGFWKLRAVNGTVF